jgi:hypothetical protein
MKRLHVHVSVNDLAPAFPRSELSLPVAAQNER